MIRRDGLTHLDYVSRWALFSDCGTYRYELGRIWNESLPLIVWILLNPSTADEDNSDATNTRCERRSKALGAGGQIFVNIFALRSKDRVALRGHTNPVGPGNDDVIRKNVLKADRVIAGWGGDGELHGRGHSVLQLLNDMEVHVECLRLTQNGHPWHPLYLPYSAMPRALQNSH